MRQTELSAKTYESYSPACVSLFFTLKQTHWADGVWRFSQMMLDVKE